MKEQILEKPRESGSRRNTGLRRGFFLTREGLLTLTYSAVNATELGHLTREQGQVIPP